jgi:branched-chain amino acid transport system permease protein
MPEGKARVLVLAVAAVALALLPFVASNYIIYLASLVGIFSLVAVGLNLLTGYTGQISLGHAGFYACGAYGTALLTQKAGLPLPVALLLASACTAVLAAVIALPALRLRSLYLAIATLGFGIVVQKSLFEWRSVTGGSGGLEIFSVAYGGHVVTTGATMYFICIALASIGTWAAANLGAGRTGRAMIMIRDSDIAAGTLCIPVARYKVLAFGISAFYVALAGGLYAYLARYIDPESFNTSLSISFLSMIVIGGLGRVPGAICGALFYVLTPEIFRAFKDAPGLIFGLSLIIVMVFMPRGLWGFGSQLWGRWHERT